MKTMKKLLAVALCLMLCLSLAVTAFAANNDPYPADSSGFVKVLNISNQIDDTGLDFEFSFAANTADSTDGAAAESFSVKLVSAGSSMTGDDVKKMTVSGDQQSGYWKINELFPATSDGKLAHGINHAGTWAFTVTESTAGFDERVLSTSTTSGGATKTVYEKLAVDSTSYTLLLDVINGTDGKLAIDGVIVKVDNEKKDPTITETPATPGSDGTDGGNRWTSGFEFANTYTQRVNVIPGPNPAEGAMSLTKSVVTENQAQVGDRGDKTLAFQFTMTVTVPESSGLTSVPATIVRDTEQPIIAPDGVTLADSVTFTPGTAATFYLSDSDTLVFESLPVGAGFEISEADYSAKNYAGVIDNAKDYINATDDFDVTCTNTYTPTPPTGIVVNNLPFALIVVLALSGMAVYFVSNRRKAEEN